ncbi:hypothetical protein [Jonesia quinghaiensis]|uniref:hypothetical protein n=1 Tax=Jonesia quinghaiensis TaxID=262806 RepID=UPI00040E435A|nr:hypothetical protein [Jonesia quinghaiensis]
MKRAFSHSPVAIKLGLRDLKNNPIATGVLIVILSIVLGYAVSLFVDQRIAWTSSFLEDQQEVGMTFSALDASSPDPASPTFDLFASFSERPTSTEDYLDGSMPYGSGESDFALLNDVLEDAIATYPITATLNDEPTAVRQDGYLIDQSIVGLAADWSRPEMSGLFTLETGRLPKADNEIVVASSKPESYVRRHDSYRNASSDHIHTLQVGDSITLTTGVNTSPYTVVGAFTPTIQRLTGDILFSHNVGIVEKSERPQTLSDDWPPDDSSKHSEFAAQQPQELLYLLPSGRLTDSQTLNLVIPLTAEAGDGGFGLRPLGRIPR